AAVRGERRMDPATPPGGTQADGPPDRSRASPAGAPPPSAVLPLLPPHLRPLPGGPRPPDAGVAERRGRSGPDVAAPRQPGFRQPGRPVPGLRLPLWAPDGSDGLAVYRPDLPRRPKAGRPLKYELPRGERACLDVPPRCRGAIRRADVPLYVVEGQKK